MKKEMTFEEFKKLDDNYRQLMENGIMEQMLGEVYDNDEDPPTEIIQSNNQNTEQNQQDKK